MTALHHALTWCRLLNKRFLKKPAFLAILLLTPLLVFALGIVSSQESGALTIALVPAQNDALSVNAVQRLQEEPSILRWLVFDSQEDARDAVIGGRADAAWVFSSEGTQSLTRSLPVVTVIEREDNVFLRLTREKLYAALYPDVSAGIFSDYLQRMGGKEQARDDYSAYYGKYVIDQPIIVLSDLGGTARQVDTNYLLSPVRGLLALLVLLSGLAGAVLLQQDRRKRLFAIVAHPVPLSIAYLLLPMLDTAVIAFFALLWVGLATSWWYEVLLLLLLIVAGGGFCAVVALLCRTPERLGVATPIITLLALVLCPIFVDLPFLHGVARLFPLQHYLHAASTAIHLRGFLLYTVAVWAFAALLYLGKKRYCNAPI